MIGDNLNNKQFDSKPPYYSVRVTIRDMSSPRSWIGYKERTIEVIYGNQTIRKTGEIDNMDIGNEATRTLKDEILHAFEESDAIAKIRGFKFTDQVKKNEKGDPIE